ncbi:hypothetical protein [Streptomyces sp. NPDC059076]|uniref:hypothetical protein n=1 Tax=unclassified Streptomyces TaxID=2593676 RepID=UPI0036AF132D
MWTGILVIPSALIGIIIGTLLQQRHERQLRAADPNRELITTISEFTTALTTLRDTSHTTRTATSGPQTTLSILAPHLSDGAEQAAQAVYGPRNASSLDELDHERTAAVKAVITFLALVRSTRT